MIDGGKYFATASIAGMRLAGLQGGNAAHPCHRAGRAVSGFAPVWSFATGLQRLPQLPQLGLKKLGQRKPA